MIKLDTSKFTLHLPKGTMLNYKAVGKHDSEVDHGTFVVTKTFGSGFFGMQRVIRNNSDLYPTIELGDPRKINRFNILDSTWKVKND